MDMDMITERAMELGLTFDQIYYLATGSRPPGEFGWVSVMTNLVSALTMTQLMRLKAKGKDRNEQKKSIKVG